jgi:hypothetical protein
MEICHKNACFAGAVGSVILLAKKEPNTHTRKHVILSKLEKAYYTIVNKLPYIDKESIHKYNIVFNNVELLLNDISCGDEDKYDNLLISLLAFYNEELPVNTKILYYYNKLVECYPKMDQYEMFRNGHRLFTRLSTEVTIGNCDMGELE